MRTAEESRASAVDRLLATYPLLLAYVVLLFLYAWQTTKHSTPWNFTDELKWAMLSRSIAHTGHAALQSTPAAADSLYAYFIAPAWWAGATAPSYAIAKYLNAAVMAGSLFPSYALARLFVPRLHAIYVGVATAAVPALVYTGLLIPEPLAYFWSTLVVWLLARALLRPSRFAIGFALASLIAAPFVRSQLIVLWLAAFLAAVLSAGLSDRSRAVVRTWTWAERFRALVLVFGLIVMADVYVAQHSNEWYIGTHFWHRAFTYGIWALGSFTIGVGIVPVLLALAWTFGARGDLRPDRRLFSLFVSAVFAFAIYASVKASYESTVFSIRVWERNLIYIAPLVFVVAARWIATRQGRVAPLFLAAAATAYLLASTPYHAYERFYSDAPGLAILQWLNRTWAFTISDLHYLLFGILAFGALLAFFVGKRDRTESRFLSQAFSGALAVTAAAVLAWNITGEIAAASASNSFSNTIAALPSPPDWIDRATGRERSLFVGQQIENSNAYWSIAFWNQGIHDVWTVDSSSPGIGATWTPNFADVDGTVSGPLIDNRWGIAPESITLAGRRKELAGGLQLYELDQPIRITSFTLDVATDGWMGSRSSFVMFGKPNAAPGRVEVTASRLASCGEIPPARLSIRLSGLRIDGNSQPAAGRLVTAKRLVVRSAPCEQQKVSFRAHPPFRLDVSATGLFKPSDGRSLSVQIGYAFTPDKQRP